MALWGLTDTAEDAPKYLNTADAAKAVFVDIGEAGVTANQAKGLQTAGWNTYSIYTTNGGTVTRHRAECLVAVAVTAANAGDAGVTGNTEIEDTIVADPE